MSKSRSRTRGFSIPAPVSRPRLVLVGMKGPAFSDQCKDCDGFDTVVIRRSGQLTTIRCTCRPAVAV